MRKLIICVSTSVFALVACVQRDSAPSSVAIEVADKYCSQNFKPYFDVRNACNAEVKDGKRGLNCATFDQVDSIVIKRAKESGFKDCPFPEVRWGPNATKK